MQGIRRFSRKEDLNLPVEVVEELENLQLV